jgi:FkbM family methyltransferase
MVLGKNKFEFHKLLSCNLMNALKVFLYRIALSYYWHFPINKGKSFFLKTAYRLMGNANFTIGQEIFSLSPVSFIDNLLLKTGKFDERITQVIKLVLADGGIYLDVGANFGYYSVIAAKLPGVSVVAIEPSPREFIRLQENCNLNNLENLKALEVAVSDIPGKRMLHLSDIWNTSMNSFNPAFKDDQPFKSSLSVEVECCRVDDLISPSEHKHLKLIKIDVEGFEYEVLKGMPNLLQNFNGVLICEITPGISEQNPNHISEIYSIMNAQGFRSFYGLDFSRQYDEFFYKPGTFEELFNRLNLNWNK